ncbi:hypothetical protein BC830DRAFT_1085194 [Chytriomyces sp. MP71]|nr:hypothetical protein BC830DRAFT_1085194 [Chytriomyces sp. MP71]
MASSADGGFENPQEYARTVDSLNYDSYPVSTIDDISEFESISTISHLHQFRKSTLRSGQYFMLGDEWETSNRKPDRILTPQKPDLSILDMNKTVATVQKMKNARSLSSRPVVWMKDFVQAMDKTFEVLDDTRRPKTAAEIFRAIELGNFDNRPFTSDAFREPTLSRAAEQPQDVLLPPILSSSSFNTMQKNARKLVKADGKVPLKPRMSSAVQRIVSVMTSHDDSSVAASTAITKVNVITNTPKIHWKRAESSGRLARMDYKAFGVSIVNADDVAQVTSALLLNKKSEPPKSKRNVKRTVQSGTISQFYDIAVELDSISALDTKTCDGWSDSDPSELKSESRSLQIKLVIQNQIDEAPQTMHHREPNHFLPPCIVCPSKMSISAKKVNTFTSIDPILLKPPRKKRSNNLASNHVSAHRRDSLAFQVDRQPFKVYKDDVDPCEPVKQLPELKRNQDKGQPARVEAKGIKYIQSLMKKVGRRGKYAVQHYEYEQNEQREVAIKTIEVPVVATAKKCQNLISSARNQPLTSKQGVLRNLASNLFNHQSSHSQCEAENETEKNLIVSQSSTFKVKGISPQGLTLRGSTVGLKPRSSDVGGVESLRDSFFLVPDIRQPSVEDFSLFINAPEGSPITDSEYSGYPIEINVRTPSTVSTGVATGFDTRSDFGTVVSSINNRDQPKPKTELWRTVSSVQLQPFVSTPFYAKTALRNVVSSTKLHQSNCQYSSPTTAIRNLF